jgi:hypothetical protein
LTEYGLLLLEFIYWLVNMSCVAETRSPDATVKPHSTVQEKRKMFQLLQHWQPCLRPTLLLIQKNARRQRRRRVWQQHQQTAPVTQGYMFSARKWHQAHCFYYAITHVFQHVTIRVRKLSVWRLFVLNCIGLNTMTHVRVNSVPQLACESEPWYICRVLLVIRCCNVNAKHNDAKQEYLFLFEWLTVGPRDAMKRIMGGSIMFAGRIMACRIFGNRIFGKGCRIIVGIWKKPVSRSVLVRLYERFVNDFSLTSTNLTKKFPFPICFWAFLGEKRFFFVQKFWYSVFGKNVRYSVKNMPNIR